MARAAAHVAARAGALVARGLCEVLDVLRAADEVVGRLCSLDALEELNAARGIGIVKLVDAHNVVPTGLEAGGRLRKYPRRRTRDIFALVLTIALSGRRPSRSTGWLL